MSLRLVGALLFAAGTASASSPADRGAGEPVSTPSIELAPAVHATGESPSIAVGHPAALAQAAEVAGREAEMFGSPTATSSATASEGVTTQSEGGTTASEGGTTSDREAEMFGSPTSDREAEMFGTPEGGATGTVGSDGKPGSRESEMFGEKPRGSGALARMTGLLAETDDILDIGGRLYMRFDYAALEEGEPEEFGLSSPNLLDVYFDARPNDHLRTYVRGRLRYDPTINEDSTSLFGLPQEQLTVALEQLWLKFDIERIVFATIGRQPLKWGSGRFWNPSDFVNTTVRDPLAVFDERLGVNLVKLHVPIEGLGWNVYAVATMDQVDQPKKLGAALRAEILVGPAEIALSTIFKDEAPTRLAIDVSAGVWEFDVRAEAAFVHGVTAPRFRRVGDESPFTSVEVIDREDDWLVQVVGGLEVAIRYGDEDSLIIGAEYFYNQLGYDDAELYPFLALNGQFIPFYLGEHYAALYFVLMSPGRWDDTTFLLSALGNLSDRSFVARLDYRVKVLTYLDVNAYAAYHFGDVGEFRLAIDIPPGTGVPGLGAGLQRAAPLLDVGIGLQLSF